MADNEAKIKEEFPALFREELSSFLGARKLNLFSLLLWLVLVNNSTSIREQADHVKDQ